jgi:hypothetical protein
MAGKKSFLKVFLIIIGVIIVIVVIASISGGSKDSDSSSTATASSEPSQTKQSVPAKVEAIEISPQALFSAYESNEVKADNTYKGKMVRLTGTVDDIGKDLFDKPYISFKSNENYFMGVQVFFKGSEGNKVADIDKGQRVTVVGKCDGKLITDVQIKDAVFE